MYDPNCRTCHGTGTYWEDVAGDGGSQMPMACDCEYSPRVVTLEELRDIAYLTQSQAVAYTVERVSRSRVTVSASNGRVRAEAVFPCYPGPDGPRVVLDVMRYTVGDMKHAREMFAPLLEGTP